MASTTVEIDALSSKPKAGNKIRKRAPKACLSCRARKVRCDVSQRGRPCMNCYLDSETCVVTGRASRFRRAQRDDSESAQASFPPYRPDANHQAHTAEEVVNSRANGRPIFADGNGLPSSENPGQQTNPQTAPAVRRASAAEASVGSPGWARNNSHPVAAAQPRPPLQHGTPAPFLGNATAIWPSQQPFSLHSDILYSYYPFLSVSNLPSILPQDVNYLELQGCLRVPTKVVLDEFVQQYFLHVHPVLPLFNEGDFWDIYCHQGRNAVPNQRISLLVLQSLLFASCNFVSRQSIKALGYSSIRSARAALYRRAKLLHDFESESSPICIAQAALLLSFWSPLSKTGVRKPNSTWLSVAIQHARAAEAHRYSSFVSPGPTGSNGGAAPTQLKRQNALKRLWWCCIMRDRIIALCLRRSIQITRAHFDFDSNDALGPPDMADETDRSRVYNPDTKRALIEILAQMMDLCVLLTDVLVLVYPLDDTPGWGRQMGPDELGRVKDGKIALRRWYKGATLKYPMFGGGSTEGSDGHAAGVGEGQGRGRRSHHHDSVILYTNLMYMYYHSSRVALCHHEVLHLATTSTQFGVGASPSRDVSTIYENRHELQDAASGVTECLKELIQLRLARWLPISAVACTALPLVLHILDVKLSLPRAGGGDGGDGTNGDGTNGDSDAYSRSALKQHRLNILIEAMKTYQPQYDGVDWVSETTRHIVNLAQLDPASGVEPNGSEQPNGAAAAAAAGGGGAIHDWTDILTSHPSLYLRLALTVDLSLSKDRLPEEGDFPASLRGLFPGGISPVRHVMGANKETGDVTEQARAAANGSSPSLTLAPPSSTRLPPHSHSHSHPHPHPQPPSSNGRMPPAQAMKEFLAGDQMLPFAMQMGLDMEPDEAAIAGLRMINDLPDADTDMDDDDDDGDDDNDNDDDDDADSDNRSVSQPDDSGTLAADGADGTRARAGAPLADKGQISGVADGNLLGPAASGEALLGPPTLQPFTAEEMDGLEAQVLEAFTLHNESPPSSESQMKAAELFGEALGQDTAGDWMEQIWGGGDGVRGGKGGVGEEDSETARALLDAMRGE